MRYTQPASGRPIAARARNAAGPHAPRTEARVALDTDRWLLNLTGTRPEQQPRLLHDELERLPVGGALYLIAQGEPDSFSRALNDLGGRRPEWRTVLAGKGMFEAVVQRS